MKGIKNVKLGFNKNADVMVVTDVEMNGNEDMDSLFLCFFTILNPPLRLSVITAGCLNEQLSKIIGQDTAMIENMMKERFTELRNKRSEKITEKINLELEKRIFLQTVDFLWRSHLQYLEHLRQVVGLRGYAQKDPLQEFKREAFRLFENLLNKIKTDFITFLNNLEIETENQNKIEKIDQDLFSKV